MGPARNPLEESGLSSRDAETQAFVEASNLRRNPQPRSRRRRAGNVGSRAKLGRISVLGPAFLAILPRSAQAASAVILLIDSMRLNHLNLTVPESPGLGSSSRPISGSVRRGEGPRRLAVLVDDRGSS